jgi:hypothetical protein
MNDFFAAIYEGIPPLDIFYINNFSNDMYNSGVYVLIGLIMIFSSFSLTALYYFAISNYNNLYKKIYWFIWILIIGIINYFVGYYNSLKSIENTYINSSNGHPYGFIQYFTYSMVNVIWSIILCFIFSLVLKIKSTRASKTPF